MYKIRDKITGLYATGGSSVHWSSEGKIWTKRGHLSNHLAQFTNPKQAYEECEIVEVKLVDVGVIPIEEWTNGVVERRKKRQKARQQSYEEYQREQRRLQFEALKKEFA